MTEDTTTENLRKFLESDDPAMVMYLERRFTAGQSKEYRRKRINYILDNTLVR
jgi:hypothetical protein